jgi:hypothetical protein
MRGTRLDGSRHLMRRVVIFGVAGGEAWARFYLEPVETGGPKVEQAIRQTVFGSALQAGSRRSGEGGA